MAAGQGFIEFSTGDVLTAAAANGYLASQVVMVFADSAARTAAIASPQEGMISFLKDTNAVEAYDGAAWVGVGGGSSPLTTKGDLYTFDTADARLGVGANGTVLTADSVEATGLKWATPSAASGLTLITSQTIGTAVASVTVTGAFSATYDNYFITIAGGSSSVNTNGNLTLGATTTGYYMTGTYFGSYNNTPNAFAINNGANWTAAYMTTNAISARIELQSPFLSKNTTFSSNPIGAATTSFIAHYAGYLADTTSYTAFTLTTGSGTMTGGEIRVYGYQNS